jgi:hypothetical protein
MKSSFVKKTAEKPSLNTNSSSGPRGISAPAVPVLQNYSAIQKAEIAEEEPLQTKLPAPQPDAIQTKFDPAVQLMGTGVIQRVKVGDKGANIITLSMLTFWDVQALAESILRDMKRAETDFGSVPDIIAAVSTHPSIAAARAARTATTGATAAAAAPTATAATPTATAAPPTATAATTPTATAAPPTATAATTPTAAAATPTATAATPTAATTPTAAAATPTATAATPTAATTPTATAATPTATAAPPTATAATGGAAVTLADRLAARQAADALERQRLGAQFVVDRQVALSQVNVVNGSFRRIPGRGGRIPDYELTTRINGVLHKLHVHGPQNADNAPGGGQIMRWSNTRRKYVMTDQTTSDPTIQEIIKHHPWPATWPRKSAAAAAATPTAATAGAATAGSSPPTATASAGSGGATSPASPPVTATPTGSGGAPRIVTVTSTAATSTGGAGSNAGPTPDSLA